MWSQDKTLPPAKRCAAAGSAARVAITDCTSLHPSSEEMKGPKQTGIRRKLVQAKKARVQEEKLRVVALRQMKADDEGRAANAALRKASRDASEERV